MEKKAAEEVAAQKTVAEEAAKKVAAEAKRTKYVPPSHIQSAGPSYTINLQPATCQILLLQVCRMVTPK